MSKPSFASLGPTLLARKGGAKPAMRPQLAPLVVAEQEIAALADDQLEDLGWNDMGHDEGDENESGADVVPISAAVAAGDLAASRNPIVRRQQRRLEERVLSEAAMTGPENAQDAAFEEFGDEFGATATYEYVVDEAEEYDEDAGEYVDEQAYAPLAAAPAAPVVARRAPARQAPRPAPRPAIRPAVAERRAAFTLRLNAERHLKLRLAATMQGVSAQVLLTEALDAMLAEFDDLDVIAAHLKRY
jgi:hypothetical protein